jgi:YHS domain-containing protein
MMKWTGSPWPFVFALAFFGCGRAPEKPTAQPAVRVLDGPGARVDIASQEESHGHPPGAHGGLIVSLGRDSYHVEALFDTEGKVRIYTLGQDETRVIDIPAKDLQGFVKLTNDLESQPISFRPESQAGDSEGRTSMLVAQLPDNMIGKVVEITIPNLAIDGERFRLAFSNQELSHAASDHSESKMPAKVADDEEQRLYLKPGGHYTQDDIAANGNLTPSQKFRGIASAHDMSPKPGDRICPVTETKANPKFVWVVGGKEYQFCCPPCIDEFLTRAKKGTDDLPPPESFVQREPAP